MSEMLAVISRKVGSSFSRVKPSVLYCLSTLKHAWKEMVETLSDLVSTTKDILDVEPTKFGKTISKTY